MKTKRAIKKSARNYPAKKSLRLVKQARERRSEREQREGN